MYGTRYPTLSQSIPAWYEHIGRSLKSYELLRYTYMREPPYRYSDIIIWDSGTGSYVLSNSDGSEVVSTNWDSETYKRFKGKYVCASTACTKVYYVVAVSTNSAHYIELTNGQSLEDVNQTWNYGKEISYENGVYTILNPTEGKRIDWYTDRSKYKGSYVCADGTTNCSTIWYVPSTSSNKMSYIEMSGGETYDSLYEEALNTPWIYGNDIEWDGSKYILKDTIESSPLNWNNDYKTIATRYHYTCFSTGDSCAQVAYIHYFNSSFPIYHFKLKGGKTIEDAKKEMFMNVINSMIKTEIDTWYRTNMLDYTDNLEDTIWCNDRSIDRGPLKSKDEDATQDSYTYFGAEGRNVRTKSPSVICPNANDKFTVSPENGNGALTYPVALLTADELTLAGHGYSGYSDYSYLYTKEWTWSLSPRNFDYGNASSFYLQAYRLLDSKVNLSGANGSHGIRPAISLAPGTIITSGDGTSENPFTVEMDG